MNIVGCIFLSCVTSLCISLCCQKRDSEQTEDRIVLIKKGIEEVVQSCPHLNQDEIICPITQESIVLGSTVKTLPCGHQFSKLIDNWILIKNECPICREKVISIN